MVSIVLIGTGNVSKHLFDAFILSTEISILQVVGRNIKALEYYKNRSNIEHDFSKIANADIYIIAVSDDAIAEVSTSLIDKKGLVVHTSGSVSMNDLSNPRKGIFYPLQTFSKEKKVDFKTIPICIEAEKEIDFTLLKKVAETLSNQVYKISSEQRKSIHLAAVFVNNFTNHLYHIGNKICAENQVSFEILKPLITETAQKVESLPPIEAQTGPAKRNDSETIERHLSQLKNKDYKDLYTLLTKSIQDAHGKKL